jgi:hypothetical protein
MQAGQSAEVGCFAVGSCLDSRVPANGMRSTPGESPEGHALCCCGYRREARIQKWPLHTATLSFLLLLFCVYDVCGGGHSNRLTSIPRARLGRAAQRAERASRGFRFCLLFPAHGASAAAFRLRTGLLAVAITPVRCTGLLYRAGIKGCASWRSGGRSGS